MKQRIWIWTVCAIAVLWGGAAYAEATPGAATESAAAESNARMHEMAFQYDEKVTPFLSPEELVAMLHSKSSGCRGTGAFEIRQRKMTSAIPDLRQLLDDKSDFVRMQAARALAWMGDATCVPVLKQFLTSEIATFRLDAAEALMTIGDESGVPVAKSYLTSEFAASRSDAITVLAQCKDEALANQAIAAGLKDEDFVRTNTIIVLGKRKTKASVDLLASLLEDPDLQTRGWALTSISNIGTKDTIPVLINALSNPYRTVRDSAACLLDSITGRSKPTPTDMIRVRALASIGMKDTIPVLINTLSSPYYLTRNDAAFLLDIITGTSKPTPIIMILANANKLQTEWQVWWEANKNKPLPKRKTQTPTSYGLSR